MTEIYQMLGIDLKGDPADAYRVFGLTPLEADAQLIRHAIGQTRKRLEPHEAGPFAADCSKVKSYLDRSEAILTDPVRKSCFDKILRSDPHGHSDETAEGTGGAGPAVVRADRDGPGPLPRPAPDGAAPVEGRNATDSISRFPCSPPPSRSGAVNSRPGRCVSPRAGPNSPARVAVSRPWSAPARRRPGP